MSMCDHINGKNILKERRLIKVVFYLEGTCTFNHEFTSNFINSTLNLYQKSLCLMRVLRMDRFVVLSQKVSSLYE